MILVRAYQKDSNSRKYYPFENDFQSYWVRETNPDTSKLSPLAKWLCENCSNVHSHVSRLGCQTRCFNGKTEMDYETNPKVLQAYGESLKRPMSIDWNFSQIRENETDEQYWNREAESIVKSGTIRIKANNKEYIL